ncbi:helix-turn-helix transcriptional regulator [Variovorax sp. J22R133]|uniref:helix-turn-helix transcriptional regulator n=1 Tax=Variovorax brevis TaxID=3053503 RepID=UPI002575EE68|nr:helix-turn-helix transcriptional regulator [Variovorax sp. J22R133]MDM0116498.1 helix-turn-helix transcriptional regulator [Variovorax sp. J22R133]
MSAIHAPAGDLEILSRIIREIQPCRDITLQLDKISRRMHEIIPFRKSVLLLQRKINSAACGLVYYNGGPSEDFSGQSKAASAISIEQYGKSFERFKQTDHAFLWSSQPLPQQDAALPAELADAARRMQGGCGLAAIVQSASFGADDVVMLWQFDCDVESPQQSLGLSVIAFCLHSTFMLHSVAPQTKSDCFGINLTSKERDVLKWVGEGKTSWEIGRIMYTSERTVKFHLKNVYAKLNVSNRAQAVAVFNRLRIY